MKKTNDLIKVVIYNLSFNEKTKNEKQHNSKILINIYSKTLYIKNTSMC